jgi:hypothetical protein
MAFYCACGFLQINLQDTTGIELLPKTIADTLWDKNAQVFAWIVPKSEKHCIIPPIHLCFVQDKKNEDIHADKDGGSGSLLNSAKEVVDIQNDLDNASNAGGSSNKFLWCQYPPSISDVDNAPCECIDKCGYGGSKCWSGLVEQPSPTTSGSPSFS